jgi:hypothetical protein
VEKRTNTGWRDRKYMGKGALKHRGRYRKIEQRSLTPEGEK